MLLLLCACLLMSQAHPAVAQTTPTFQGVVVFQQSFLDKYSAALHTHTAQSLTMGFNANTACSQPHSSSIAYCAAKLTFQSLYIASQSLISPSAFSFTPSEVGGSLTVSLSASAAVQIGDLSGSDNCGGHCSAASRLFDGSWSLLVGLNLAQNAISPATTQATVTSFVPTTKTQGCDQWCAVWKYEHNEWCTTGPSSISTSIMSSSSTVKVFSDSLNALLATVQNNVTQLVTTSDSLAAATNNSPSLMPFANGTIKAEVLQLLSEAGFVGTPDILTMTPLLESTTSTLSTVSTPPLTIPSSCILESTDACSNYSPLVTIATSASFTQCAVCVVSHSHLPGESTVVWAVQTLVTSSG